MPKIKPYHCLFNHELVIAIIAESPYQSYRENVSQRQLENLVYELQDTDVDAIMCCPTGWKMPLYPSDVDPKWSRDLLKGPEPLPESDWKFFDKAYWRARRLMLSGIDPVRITVDAAHKIGRDIFVSYRMNDHHYNMMSESPTHSRFWRENRQYYIRPENPTGVLTRTSSSIFGYSSPSNLDYAHAAVRDYFRRILGELVEKYPFDGLELDFMRTPPYFGPDRVAAGAPLMTEFVASIRALLDEAGAKRNKYLPLCVRVPRSIAGCDELGLDVAAWAKRGLIQMANVSSFYMNAHNLDIEDFKARLPGVRVFGEMHFVYEPGEIQATGYNNNISRKTPDDLYRATAFAALARGADGVSLFNFDYVREHSFYEPRRTVFPGKEPHFAVLRGITDREALAAATKLYHFGFGYAGFPLTLGSMERGEVKIHVADDLTDATTVLRLECKESYFSDVELSINGTKLEQLSDRTGELAKPLSMEALPRQENLLYYAIPPGALRTGWNTVLLSNTRCKQYNRGDVTIRNLQVLVQHPATTR